MEISVRSAQLADVAEVLALWQVAGENAGRPLDHAAGVEALVRRDPEALLLAHHTVDGHPRLVGSVIAGWDGWRAHLYRLAVHPDVRRRGVAGRLLDHAERRLRGLGASRLDAMVLDTNTDGQAAWAARGYRRQPDWSRWVRS